MVLLSVLSASNEARISELGAEVLVENPTAALSAEDKTSEMPITQPTAFNFFIWNNSPLRLIG
jgi:hypothetical protein